MTTQSKQNVLGSKRVDGSVSPVVRIFSGNGEEVARGDLLHLTKTRNFGLAQGSKGKYTHRYTLELSQLDEVSAPLATFEVTGTRPLVLKELS